MVTFSYARSYYQDYLVRQEILRLQEEARGLEAKKIKLLDILKYVKSDAFVEAKARSELNMARPGEQVAVLPFSREELVGQKKNNMVGSNERSNFKKWWDYFFNEKE